jgi:heat-inducible transcriptional repressor
MIGFMLEGRNREVLAATIRSFILTGEPVGSRTISRKRRDGLSAATIRNIMADLEAAGYLEQPHTSAGRVPTEKAYRFYVAHVARPERYQNSNDAELIRRQLRRDESRPQTILERASHVLATISRNVGVVVAPTAADLVLHHIQLVALSDNRVLVLVEPRGAPTRSRMVRMDEEIPQDELGRIANYLNQNFTGWRLEAARAEIVRRLEEERALYDALLRGLAVLWRKGFLPPEGAAEIYLDGASNLMDRPELADPGMLRELLRTLEEKQRLVELLLRYIQTEDVQQALHARVVIGLDADPPVRGFALIGAVCTTEQGLAGRVAVLGPPRMAYERVISAVAQVARIVGDAMNERS